MSSALVNILSGGLLDGISKVINSIRGKNPEDAAKLEQLKMQYQADFIQAQIEQRKADIQELQMQADVNKVEAASPSVWVSGWRPGIGWVCGSALAFQFVLGPLMTWVAALAGHPIVVPKLDMGDLITLLLGMLGLGSMRTAEKIKGIGKDNQ